MHAIHYSCALINALFSVQRCQVLIYTITALVEHSFYKTVERLAANAGDSGESVIINHLENDMVFSFLGSTTN